MSSVPARPPKVVTAYSTSPTSLVVKWSHVPKHHFRKNPIGYNIYYISTLDDKFKSLSVNYTTNTITLRNLRVYTKYYVSVAAVNSAGEGDLQRTYVSTGESRFLFFSPLFLSCLLF